MLKIHLLGAPYITFNETAIRMKRRKSLALLCYLVMRPHAIARDTLASLLWGDHDNERARSELRVALWEVNKALGTDWLIVNRDNVQINPEKTFWLDVQAFREQIEAPLSHQHRPDEICVACMPHYEAAYQLYIDDFLAGFTVSNSPEFDDWQLVEAEALRMNYSAVLHKLVLGSSALQRIQAGLEYTQRWLALDAFNEEAHRYMMSLQIWSGNKTAALQHYRTCEQLLADELGIEPSEQTTTLYNNLKDGILPNVPFIYYDLPDEPAHSHSNLPPQPNPFRGRSAEVAQLVANLQHDDCRLLTITGLGGVGKTRLAIYTARQMLPHFADGVFFVSLGGVFDSYGIMTEIAESIGLQFTANDDLQTQLFKHLEARQMLILLDNFEHLLAYIELVERMLACAPKLTIMATSRLPLSLKAEWIFTLDQMTEGAEQLFIDIAIRADTYFAPDDDAHTRIKAICQRLAGVPLAIELAATWVRVLSLPEILAEVEQNVELLMTEWADIPERHRDLQATFDYSWNLLDQSQQMALAKLAIFPSSFSYETARAVTGVSLRVLSTLAAQVLVKRNAEGRYELHTLIRQFALAKLRQYPANYEEVTLAFIAHFNQFLVGQYVGLIGERVVDAKAAIVREIDSVRAAFVLAFEKDAVTALYDALPTLNLFYDFQSWIEEGKTLFERLTQVAPHDEAFTARAKVFFVRYLRFSDNYPLARSIVEQLVETAGGASADKAFAYYNMANLLYHTDFDSAMRYITQALEIYQQLHDAHGMGMTLCLAVETLTQKGELEQALDYSERASKILSPLGRTMQFAFLQTALCLLHSYRGDLEAALKHGSLAVELYQTFNNKERFLRAQLFVAHVMNRKGDYADAKALLEGNIAEARAINAGETLAHALTEYGINAYYRQDYVCAVQVYEEIIALSEKLGMDYIIDTTKVNLASALTALREYSRAESLLLQALEAFETIDSEYGIICVNAGLGKNYICAGQYEKAEQALQRSIQLAERSQMTVDWLTAIFYLGMLRFHQKQYENALKIVGFVIHHQATESQIREEANDYHKKIVVALGQEQARHLLAQATDSSIQQWLD